MGLLRSLLAAALLVGGAALGAQDAVGIDEKLGARVPMELQLRGEDGNLVPLKSLLGKPTLLTLNYFRCAGICTPLLNGTSRLLKEIALEPGRDFRVITVSFDPRDNAEIAATKRINYLRDVERPVPPEAWRFLTGDAASTRALCDAVGFQFKRDREEFIHAAALVVLAPDGQVTRYLYGTTFLPADVQAALGEAVRNEPTPTISRLLKICFSYDPVGRKHVFSATRFGAVVVLTLAVGFAIWLLRPRKRVNLQTGDSR